MNSLPTPLFQRARRLGTVAGRVGPPLIGILLLLCLWTAGGLWLVYNPRTATFAGFAPAPAFSALDGMLRDGTLWRDFLPSAIRIGLGLVWAIVLGVPAGIVVGRSTFFHALTHLPFQLLRMVSPLAWMPVAILLFSSWDGAIVFLIAAAAVWPVLFSTANGVRKIDPDWFKLAHNLGGNIWRRLQIIILPAIAQDVATGVRLALGTAWIVLVPAEFLGVDSGLGYAINDARDTLDYARLAALILAIGLIGFALDTILQSLVRRTGWVRAQRDF